MTSALLSCVPLAAGHARADTLAVPAGCDIEGGGRRPLQFAAVVGSPLERLGGGREDARLPAAHDFKIDGKKTPLLKPGKSSTLKVVFKKKGRFAYLCTVPGHAALGMKGVLGVGTTAPPQTPTAKTTTTTAIPGPGGTVQVSMFEYGFKLSPSTIPSGNVTFVMSNTGTVTHNFDVEGVKAGPFVDPGKSATMTVNVQAGRAYSYQCDVPGHAALGMRGTFAPSS